MAAKIRTNAAVDGLMKKLLAAQAERDHEKARADALHEALRDLAAMMRNREPFLPLSVKTPSWEADLAAAEKALAAHGKES